jgi:solute:Na+ symporter, SSS family
LATPPESPETLKRFYERCRPPGFWRPVRESMDVSTFDVPSTRSLLVSSLLGILACLNLVLATNALFVSGWPMFALYLMVSVAFSAALIVRIIKAPASSAQLVGCSPANPVVYNPVN